MPESINATASFKSSKIIFLYKWRLQEIIIGKLTYILHRNRSPLDFNTYQLQNAKSSHLAFISAEIAYLLIEEL